MYPTIHQRSKHYLEVKMMTTNNSQNRFDLSVSRKIMNVG